MRAIEYCAVHDGNGGGGRAAQGYEPPPALLSIVSAPLSIGGVFTGPLFQA
jgi:hypothetical protein